MGTGNRKQAPRSWTLSSDEHDSSGPESVPEPVRSPRPRERSKHVFPGLFKQKALTVISVARRVNSEPLAMVLASRASRQMSLPLFGPSAALPTIVCHGVCSGDERADTDALWEAIEKAEQIENTEAVADMPAALQKLHQSGSKWTLWNFDIQATHERFLTQLPANALIIINDIEKWISAGAIQKNYDDLASHFDDWCQHGHTVVVFEKETDEGTPNLKAALHADVDLLHATWDEGAPHELGGGCIITRKKNGYFDSSPQHFNFWFKVFRHEFEWGLEIRTDADPLGGKQSEVYQRRMQVDSWLKDGIPQKAIAKRLGRDAATISRDVKALRDEYQWD